MKFQCEIVQNGKDVAVYDINMVLFLFSSLSFTLEFFETGPGIRRSHLQIFFEIDVLKNFPIFTGKQLCWNLFLINKASCLKRDSNTGIFL